MAPSSASVVALVVAGALVGSDAQAFFGHNLRLPQQISDVVPQRMKPGMQILPKDSLPQEIASRLPPELSNMNPSMRLPQLTNNGVAFANNNDAESTVQQLSPGNLRDLVRDISKRLPQAPDPDIGEYNGQDVDQDMRAKLGDLIRGIEHGRLPEVPVEAEHTMEEAEHTMERLRACCRAMTADCLACSAGTSVEDFCGRLPKTPGCSRSTRGSRPATPLGPICSGDDGGPAWHLQAGDKVLTSHGRGIVACVSADDENRVGVCGAVRMGHDNYGACEPDFGGATGERPDFCGDKSLWFLPCSEVKDAFTQRPQMPPPVPPPAEEPSMCGCSWSSQRGCGTSGQQLIAGLHALPDAVCGGDDIEECIMRKRMSEVADKFESCFDMDPRECKRSEDLCLWGAQTTGECGVNVPSLVKMLVKAATRDEKSLENPLVKMVTLSQFCMEHREEECAMEPKCVWEVGSEGSRCGVSPRIILELMLRDARLLLDGRQAHVEATCRTMHEASHGYDPECSEPCAMTSPNGVCALSDPDFNQDMPISRAMGMLCRKTQPDHGRSCPNPCRMMADGSCGLAGGIRMKIPEPSPLDKSVVKVFAILMSSTMVYDQRCHAPGVRDDPGTCQAVDPVCDQEEHVFVGGAESAGGHGGGDKPSLPWREAATGTGAAVGLAGTLHKAAEALSQGKADQFLGEYLENNPDAVQNITSKAWHGLASLFHSSDATATQDDPEARVPETIAHNGGGRPGRGGRGPPPPKPGPRFSGEEVWDDGPQRDDDDDEEEHQDDDGPVGAVKMARVARLFSLESSAGAWMMATLSLLVAVLCAGVAFGVLCHARTSRVAAREPLLQSAMYSGGPMPKLNEQEMETTIQAPLAPGISAANAA